MNDSDTIEWLDVTYKTILSTEATGGAMSIVDSTAPVGSGPPCHIHHAEDETFVILSGQVRVWVEGEETILNAGESAFIPRGKAHTFKIIGDSPCHHLVILTPGGFEGFFAEMAAGNCAIPEDMDKVIASGEKFHMTFAGPPLD